MNIGRFSEQKAQWKLLKAFSLYLNDLKKPVLPAIVFLSFLLTKTHFIIFFRFSLMTDHIKIIICPFCQKQQNHCCDNNHSRNNEPCRIDPYDTFIFLLPAIGIDVIIIFKYDWRSWNI